MKRGAGEAGRAKMILSLLDRRYPQARCSLAFSSPLELLVATILSAQCTDERVNMVTPALFAACPDASASARATPADLETHIRSLGLFRSKARNIVSAMRRIEAEHGGRVPTTRPALEALPGVGRKTAGVVLVHLGAAHAFPVDTHVGRLARRLGFSAEERPDRVEQELMRLFPERDWGEAHQLLVWHGRRVCRARAPDCPACPVRDLCPTGRTGAAGPS